MVEASLLPAGMDRPGRTLPLVLLMWSVRPSVCSPAAPAQENPPEPGWETGPAGAESRGGWVGSVASNLGEISKNEEIRFIKEEFLLLIQKNQEIQDGFTVQNLPEPPVDQFFWQVLLRLSLFP